MFRNRANYEQLRACVPPGSHALLQALENLQEKDYESETSDAGLRALHDDLDKVMRVESVRQWLVKATNECQFQELLGFSDFGYFGDFDGNSPVHQFSYDGKSYVVEDAQRRTIRSLLDNKVRT